MHSILFGSKNQAYCKKLGATHKALNFTSEQIKEKPILQTKRGIIIWDPFSLGGIQLDANGFLVNLKVKLSHLHTQMGPSPQKVAEV